MLHKYLKSITPMNISDPREGSAYWGIKKRYREPSDKVTRAFVLPKIAYIQRKILLKPRTSLLDIGAGNGTYTLFFNDLGCKVYGVEYSRHMIDMSPCRFLLSQADVRALPFKNGSFDIVFCSNLLHHVEEPIHVVLEMKRVSRTFVIFCEPNRNNPGMLLYSLIVKFERGGLKFSKSYLTTLAKNAGLGIISCDSMGMVYQNKTPSFLLPFLKIFDKPIPFGAYTVLIGRK